MSNHSSQSSRASSPSSSKTPSEDECEIPCEGDLSVVRRMLGTIQIYTLFEIWFLFLTLLSQ